MPATYEPIATTTLSSAASTITFSSIGSGYTDLRVIFSGLGTTGAGQYANMRLNSDTGTNYSNTRFKVSGTSIISQRTSGITSIWLMDNYELNSTIPTFCTADIYPYGGSNNAAGVSPLTTPGYNGCVCSGYIVSNGATTINFTIGHYSASSPGTYSYSGDLSYTLVRIA